MNCEEVLRVVAIIAEFFSQLDDDLIEGAGGAEIIVAPDFVEKTVARKDLAGMLRKKLEQFEFFGGEFFGHLAALELESLRVNGRRTDLEQHRSIRRCCRRVGSPEEGVNPGEQFTDAEG